jgi:hypothetical protein
VQNCAERCKTMNTSILYEIRKILVGLRNVGEKRKPKDYQEEQHRDSQLTLLQLYINEVDREIVSNQKRSERAKRCMNKKTTGKLEQNETVKSECHF